MNSVHRLWLTILVVSFVCFPASLTFAESRGKIIKQATKLIRQAEFAEAEKLYRQLLEKDDKDKEARLGLSFTLLKQSKLQDSYEQAATVLAVDPLSSRAHALLGSSLLRSGEFRNSIESLYTAVKFNNRESLAIAGLAEIEYFENRSRNAYDGIKRAVQLEPQEPDYYLSLARASSRLEYYKEAADAYQNFLDVSPKTDVERRARIRGLIDFYRYLGSTKIHRPSGKEINTVKIRLVNNRPFIDVMINGKGPHKFVIDTGASLSVISDKLAATIGIKPVAKGGQARAIGGTGTFAILYGILDSLAIGDTKIDSVPVYIRTVHNDESTPDSDRADGYIGLSMLSNFEVTLDYQEKTMTLDRTPIRNEQVANVSPPHGVNSDKLATNAIVKFAQVEIPIRSTSGGLASAETQLPTLDRPLNFIIDTGATASVISKAAVEKHQLESMKMKGVTFRVIGAAGISEGAEALGLDTLTVNGLKKGSSRALILDLDSVNETSGFEQHGILGGDYLTHFKVILDMRRFQFKLTPQTSAITVVDGKL